MEQISMNKIKDILKQKFIRKIGYRKIAANLNLSIATVANYVARAKKAGITSWSLVENMSEQELRQKLFGKQRVKQCPSIDYDHIHNELKKKGVTLLLLWQEYKEGTSNGIGYTQFCLHYRRYKNNLDPVMVQTHKAGEKSFVDYAGTTMSFIDSATGEIVKAQIFVGSVGASSFIYAEATRSQQTHDWLGSNKRMFEYCGCVTMDIVPDNLKSGVKKAHRYDPDLNPAYREFGLHYNVAIMPARVVHPRDKASAESAVHLVTTQIIAPLRNRQFYDLASLNKAIRERLDIVNNTSFQKKKTTRKMLFEELDRPAMQPLPRIPFEYGHWKKAKVNIDYHVAYDDHYYSVPYSHCGKHVMLRATSSSIEFFLDNERIAAHARSHEKYKHTTLEAHMPKSHQEQAKWTSETVVEGAKRIGPNTTKLLTVIINKKDFPQQGLRPCIGVLRLAEAFGSARLEKASAKALLVGMTRQHEIHYMLKNNLEDMPTETVAKPPPKHENIRGAHYYQ